MHSENCVVLLLSAWVKSEAHPACSSEQMKHLACCVRIRHVSPQYLLAVLPHLSWFQDDRVVEALDSLALQSALLSPPGLNVRVFSAWRAGKRSNTSLPESAALTWVLGPHELGELEAAAPRTPGQPRSHATLLSPGNAYLDGVAYKLLIGKYVDPKDAAKVTFGLFLTKDDALMDPVLGSPSPGQRQRFFWILAEVSAGSKRFFLNNISPSSFGRSDTGRSDVFGQSGSTLQEVVAPYLVEGRLTLKAVVKSG